MGHQGVQRRHVYISASVAMTKYVSMTLFGYGHYFSGLSHF